MFYKKDLRNDKKGITLIALIVTIIVLLILAGVSIAMLTGENGILTQAQRAKTETENAARQEEEDLAKLEAMVNGQDVPIIQVDDKNPGQLEQEDETTFVINSIEDLVFFSYDVTNNGNKYENQTVKLGTNLDFSSDKSYVDPDRTDYGIYGYEGNLKQLLISGEGFIPIGQQQLEETNYFYGTFDGNNNAICSLYININKNENVRVGFFTVTYGEIKNLNLINVNIFLKVASTTVGGIVARGYSNISNCFVSGNMEINGNLYMPIGGICGVLDGKANIENCVNHININCINTREEMLTGNIGCGGIVGQIEGEDININKCYNKGNINANGELSSITIGGIVGSPTCKNGSIKNCYNIGIIQGKSQATKYNNIGGIVGILYTKMQLENCYNLGQILGKTENQLFIGGIVGNQWENSNINNVFNYGAILIEAQNTVSAGGIIGYENSKMAIVSNVYNVGIIETEKEEMFKDIGSIIGNTKPNNFTNCYYLKGTYTVGVGGSVSSEGAIELNSIEDFPSVLEVVNREGAFKEDINNKNNGYPILEWE